MNLNHIIASLLEAKPTPRLSVDNIVSYKEKKNVHIVKGREAIFIKQNKIQR